MNFHEIEFILGASVVPARIFEADIRLFVVAEVNCTGTETKLLECSHSSIEHHLCDGSTGDADQVAIVCGMFLCPPPPPPPPLLCFVY